MWSWGRGRLNGAGIFTIATIEGNEHWLIDVTREHELHLDETILFSTRGTRPFWFLALFGPLVFSWIFQDCEDASWMELMRDDASKGWGRGKIGEDSLDLLANDPYSKYITHSSSRIPKGWELLKKLVADPSFADIIQFIPLTHWVVFVLLAIKKNIRSWYRERRRLDCQPVFSW